MHLLRTTAGNLTSCKEIRARFLTLLGRDGPEMAFCLPGFLFVNACPVMWALVQQGLDLNLRTLAPDTNPLPFGQLVRINFKNKIDFVGIKPLSSFISNKFLN